MAFAPPAPTWPSAGAFLGKDASSNAETSKASPFTIQEGAKKDPRVEWSSQAAQTLKLERTKITKEMERSNDLYDGVHWTSPRAPWKNSAFINYASVVCDTWTAMLMDSKQRSTYETYRLQDQSIADLCNAELTDWMDRTDFQQVLGSAVLSSRIEKKAYLRLTYDPFTPYGNGYGDQVCKVVSAMQVWKNKEAMSVKDASLLLYEYWAQTGDILFQFPSLQGKIDGRGSMGNVAYSNEGTKQLVPPQVSSSAQHATIHVPPYSASASPPADRGSGGVLVREWWSRPRGPESQVTIQRLKWNAAGKPSCKVKTITFEDGTVEQLMTVITEGLVVYMMPQSCALMFQEAGEMLGGIKVLHMTEALEAECEDHVVPLYPNGRRMVIVGDYVADDGANPFAGHGRWPFIEINANRRRRRQKGLSAYADGDIDRFYPLQEYLNRLYALLLDAAILTSNPLWIIPLEAQISDEDITNAPGAIIRGETMFTKLARRDSPPNMPPYVEKLLAFTIGQIREVSGLSEIATGGKMKGQVAAETVSMMQDAAGLRFRDAIRALGQAQIEFGEQFQGNMTQFYQQPRVLRIKNAIDAEQTMSFFGADISTPMRMKVKDGSALPSSPSARLNYYLQLAALPLPVIDLPEIWRALESVGLIDSAHALEKRITNYTKNPKELWKIPSLLQILMGGGSKPKKGGGKRQSGGNAGRSARARTPSQAA